MAQRCGTALALWLLVPADDHRGAARGLEAAQAGSGPTPAGLVGDLFRSAAFRDWSLSAFPAFFGPLLGIYTI